MAASKQAAAKPKTGKGSKAACEAAGWKFAPLPHIGGSPFVPDNQLVKPRYRYEGARGTMAIPPTGSGIEPRQFGGSIRAVAWAVEQLGEIAKQPDEAPAGMEGVRLLLAAALASGEICGGATRRRGGQMPNCFASARTFSVLNKRRRFPALCHGAMARMIRGLRL